VFAGGPEQAGVVACHDKATRDAVGWVDEEPSQGGDALEQAITKGHGADGTRGPTPAADPRTAPRTAGAARSGEIRHSRLGEGPSTP
jgi:hypothetical protein